jgi:hypothetical protein
MTKAAGYDGPGVDGDVQGYTLPEPRLPLGAQRRCTTQHVRRASESSLWIVFVSYRGTKDCQNGIAHNPVPPFVPPITVIMDALSVGLRDPESSLFQPQERQLRPEFVPNTFRDYPRQSQGSLGVLLAAVPMMC